MMAKTVRAERVNATRELILATAERMFAERGLHEVSNRQISEAAGQGNNTAVGYHFGTKTDLIKAILQKHAAQVEERRRELIAEAGDSQDLRVWVSCLVRPTTDYLATLGIPSWVARFNAQLMNDPVLRGPLVDDLLTSQSMQWIIERLDAILADLPLEVRMERGSMTRLLILQMCAEYERALADGEPTNRATWHDMATGLIDGIVGVWNAPVTQ
ncbi:TetR/AcrR family transcriptional regulator [Kribbella sp. NPDC056345]|uniref:TetR/AcrR family transcriptional regulator n=1 Tax=Kribbella sp. NPDC056345 TaxID=3345789 RepID=UPI0035DE7D04